MKKISADGATAFSKAGFVLPLVALSFMILIDVSEILSGGGSLIVLIILAAMFPALVFLGRRFVWSLADEVYDCGDSLLVRRGKMEERVALTNIVDVSNASLSRPPRVTIDLALPGIFGSSISFVPTDTSAFLPFSGSGIPKTLRDRARNIKSTGLAS
jgi:hypothetical protein